MRVGIFKKTLILLVIHQVLNAQEDLLHPIQASKEKSQEHTSSLPLYKKHYLGVISQNDAYFNSVIDRYYTAGQGILYSSPEGDYGLLGDIGLIKGNTSFSVAINQSIYTPVDKFASIPAIGDHPYAGYLNLGFALHHRTQNFLETLGVRFGVSGKYSFAQEAQNGIHALMNLRLSNGWDTQIGDEVILNLSYELAYRYGLFYSHYFDIDVIPSLELAFGNANVFAKLGGIFRMGYNLKTTFLPQGIAGENWGFESGRVYSDGVGVYGFAGIYGSYVGHNLFIQGNVFGSSAYPINTQLENFVGSVVGGFSIVSGVMSFTYQIIYSSKEFKTQDGSHAIGSFAFSCSF
ncbi:lipid A deacylase LpxR family protein [Helicobacter cholecystus]|uniref:lipid A deacylase LpxR family protein n=1 Tax=Helicobacter cholecystus TaxID=45498 RepID=UPI00273A5013|nr:lipid A deacylase LpxR family protein [Helicobacter cholecystus]